MACWNYGGPTGSILDDIMVDNVAQAALAGLRLAAMRPAFKPVHLLSMRRWLAGWLALVKWLAALNRPLELDVCLDDHHAAVAYVIDNPVATH